MKKYDWLFLWLYIIGEIGLLTLVLFFLVWLVARAIG